MCKIEVTSVYEVEVPSFQKVEITRQKAINLQLKIEVTSLHEVEVPSFQEIKITCTVQFTSLVFADAAKNYLKSAKVTVKFDAKCKSLSNFFSDAFNIFLKSVIMVDIKCKCFNSFSDASKIKIFLKSVVKVLVKWKRNSLRVASTIFIFLKIIIKYKSFNF